jgi:hypothetical protein
MIAAASRSKSSWAKLSKAARNLLDAGISDEGLNAAKM